MCPRASSPGQASPHRETGLSCVSRREGATLTPAVTSGGRVGHPWGTLLSRQPSPCPQPTARGTRSPWPRRESREEAGLSLSRTQWMDPPPQRNKRTFQASAHTDGLFPTCHSDKKQFVRNRFFIRSEIRIRDGSLFSLRGCVWATACLPASLCPSINTHLLMVSIVSPFKERSAQTDIFPSFSRCLIIFLAAALLASGPFSLFSAGWAVTGGGHCPCRSLISTV